MSVSFYVEMGNITGHQVRCYCGSNYDYVFEDYDNAASYLGAVKSLGRGLRDCFGEDCWNTLYVDALHDASDAPLVNMTHSNAAKVLSFTNLDVTVDYGEMSARDFIDEVSVILADGADLGNDSTYVKDRANQLLDVAVAARTLGRKVMWS